MAQAIDSSYEWGIDPQNQGNLSAQQLIGLGSLAPQFGLSGGAPLTPLSPYAALPTPQFSKGAAAQVASKLGYAAPTISGGDAAGPGSAPGVYTAPSATYNRDKTAGAVDSLTADVTPAAGGAAPYFDPNFPAESMLALKNWLAPQVANGTADAMRARGIESSGLLPSAENAGTNYLSQLAPVGETGQQALSMDFDRLYGPDITNSLVEGTKPGATITIPGGQTFKDPYAMAASIPGGETFGNGETGGIQAQLETNKAGNISDTNPSKDSPLYGLVTDQGFGAYAGPGYQYNPNAPPNPVDLPWLKNATPYSGS